MIINDDERSPVRIVVCLFFFEFWMAGWLIFDDDDDDHNNNNHHNLSFHNIIHPHIQPDHPRGRKKT